MLRIVLDKLSVRQGRRTVLHELDLHLDEGSHAALLGSAGAGKTSLLKAIAGELRAASGTIIIGRQEVQKLGPLRRPVLLSSRDATAPLRWTVRHALVASLSRSGLDRQDRFASFEEVSRTWDIDAILDLRFRDLSTSERDRVRLAQIELLRPAILLAERMFSGTSGAEVLRLAALAHRALRAIGTTVISEVEHSEELEFFDRVIVLDRGQVIQSGVPQEVLEAPRSIEAALASGPANLLPIRIAGCRVDSPIGFWSVDPAPFQGEGTAIARPHDFVPAATGEESDFVLGIERAAYRDGSWHVEGFVTGGLLLRATLPAGLSIHKGRLVALRYDPRRFVLLPVAPPEQAARDRPGWNESG